MSQQTHHRTATQLLRTGATESYFIQPRPINCHFSLYISSLERECVTFARVCVCLSLEGSFYTQILWCRMTFTWTWNALGWRVWHFSWVDFFRPLLLLLASPPPSLHSVVVCLRWAEHNPHIFPGPMINCSCLCILRLERLMDFNGFQLKWIQLSLSLSRYLSLMPQTSESIQFI